MLFIRISQFNNLLNNHLNDYFIISIFDKTHILTFNCHSFMTVGIFIYLSLIIHLSIRERRKDRTTVGERLTSSHSLCVSAHMYCARVSEKERNITEQSGEKKRIIKLWPLTSALVEGEIV